MAEKLNTLGNEKKLQIVRKATPTIEDLMNDKAFRDGITKATGSRISSGNCLNILMAMSNLEILKEIKKLNDNLMALIVPEEEIEDTSKKKK